MTDHLAEELQIYIDEMEANRDPDDNEIEAYARECNRIQGDEDAVVARHAAERAKLDANRDKMLKGVENARKAIEYRWGQLVREKIFAKLSGKKARFVDTLFGRLGWRKTPAKTKRIFRDGCDKATALEWAKKNCPDAVNSRTSEAVIVGELPADCPQIWVEDVPAGDNFYWKPNKKQEKNDE